MTKQISRSKPRLRKEAPSPVRRKAKLSTGQRRALAVLYDELFMQPWFIPKRTYLAIRRLLPNIHLMKMRHYFDDYGCLRCGEADTIYGASGFCHSCNIIVRSRILTSLKKRLKKAHIKWEATVSDHFFDQMNLAQLILYGSARGATSRLSGQRRSVQKSRQALMRS